MSMDSQAVMIDRGLRREYNVAIINFAGGCYEKNITKE